MSVDHLLFSIATPFHDENHMEHQHKKISTVIRAYHRLGVGDTTEQGLDVILTPWCSPSSVSVPHHLL